MAPRIHIFRPGTFRSRGVAHTFSESDIRTIAGAYDPTKHEAPIVVGQLETSLRVRSRATRPVKLISYHWPRRRDRLIPPHPQEHIDGERCRLDHPPTEAETEHKQETAHDGTCGHGARGTSPDAHCMGQPQSGNPTGRMPAFGGERLAPQEPESVAVPARIGQRREWCLKHREQRHGEIPRA